MGGQRVHMRPRLKAGFHQDFLPGAQKERREERGRAANRKAESSSALYNSVPQRLSDAIRKFLQLEEFQWTISSATPQRVLGVHTLLFLARNLIANQSSRRGGGRIYFLLLLLLFFCLPFCCFLTIPERLLHHERRTELREEDREYSDGSPRIYGLPPELQGLPDSPRVLGDGHGLLQRTDGPRPPRVLPEPAVRTAHELLPPSVQFERDGSGGSVRDQIRVSLHEQLQTVRTLQQRSPAGLTARLSQRRTRAGGPHGERKAQKDPQAEDDLLQLPAGRPAEALPEGAVPRPARESGAGGPARPHSDSGQDLVPEPEIQVQEAVQKRRGSPGAQSQRQRLHGL